MARRLVAPGGLSQSDKDAAAKAAKRWAALTPPKVDWKSGGEGSEVDYSLWGFQNLVDAISLMPQVAQDAAGYQMEIIASEVIATAKDGLVPYRTGELSKSGDYDRYEPNKDISIAQISMWFGAPNSGIGSGAPTMSEATAIASGAHKVIVDPSEYALIQHEDTTFNHPGGGGPKYLEIPFMEALPTVLPRIADSIGEALRMNPQFVQFAINSDDAGSAMIDSEGKPIGS